MGNEESSSTVQKKSLHRIARFLISGGTAAAVEYLSFLVFIHYFHELLVLSNITSFLLGLVTSFLLNRQWVFKDSTSARRQFVLYLAVAAVNLVLSTAIIWLLADKLGLSAAISKLFVMALIASWNYIIFSQLIFVHSSK